jgi:NADPH:quinone reductase-like Zn-dependent oxidoreductase
LILNKAEAFLHFREKTMKAIELTAHSLTAFRQTELPDPKAGHGEVLVRLRAATLNFADVAVATGAFPGAIFPLIPVADGAGEIAALGEGVSGLAIGDRVIPHFMPNWQGGAMTPRHVAAMRGITLPGSLAEYVVVPATSLVALPAHLDFVQGAALPIAATTAWNAVRSAQLRPGSVVVLLGTGGVSIFALQFAKASGATVILASSSDEKLERARQLGADHLINYRALPAWDEQVLKLTDGRGADLVVETVGGATFARALNAAAMGGTVFTVGFVSGTAASIDLLPIIVKALRIVGNSTGSVADLAEAARAISAHRIVPVIDRVFSIEDTRAAYAELSAGGRHFGKLAIAH